MAQKGKYRLNPETLIVELKAEKHHRLLKALGVLLGGAVLFALYVWLYGHVLGNDLPKTAILKRQSADWLSRLEQMEGRLDRDEEVLSLLEVRDDRIYRSVYGMDEIPAQVRSDVPGVENRYPALAAMDRNNLLRRTAARLDGLSKAAYVQSKSFDEVSALADAAGDKAAHIPAIPPMSTAPGSFTLTSPFGVRSDPITGAGKMHTGMDFACPPGNPVYATGDGVVILVENDFYGYGNHIEVDHGFGYVTRYSHLSDMYAYVGQKVRRGDCLGTSGRSGRVTGPHLHYEVMYRHDYVNPAAYMDLDISPEDYAAMVRKPFRR
ncbi:MAG: M23 family metallopeptidase [Bacteroidales bacterium]|nr:M23 family metallopeptidase [Bacteroidales bacterium]